MAFRKGTIRKMPKVTKRIAKAVNDLDTLARRFKNAIADIHRLEQDYSALQKWQKNYSQIWEEHKAMDQTLSYLLNLYMRGDMATLAESLHQLAADSLKSRENDLATELESSVQEVTHDRQDSTVPDSDSIPGSP